MRVLQVHNYYKTRGGECEVVDKERKLLEDAGHQVFRYSRKATDIDSYGIVRKIFQFIGIVFNVAVYYDVQKYIKEIKPDIAHVHNVFPLLSPSVYLGISKSGIPIVQTVHNYRFMCPSGLLFRSGAVCEQCIDRGLFSVIRRRCIHGSYTLSLQYALAVWSGRMRKGFLGKIDRFIALNHFGEDRLQSIGINKDRICICPNYIDHIDTAGVSGSKDYFLYLGRLSHEKGIDLVLEAAQDLPDTRFIIAGAGPMESRVREFTGLCNLEWVGRISGDKKNQMIRHARALLVPSMCYENNPLSVIEALSSGTTVIVSRTGGLPEMFDDRKSGLLFEQGNLDEFKQMIIALTDTETCEKYSIAALETAKQRYIHDVHLRRLQEIYKKVLNQD